MPELRYRDLFAAGGRTLELRKPSEELGPEAVGHSAKGKLPAKMILMHSSNSKYQFKFANLSPKRKRYS